MNEQEKFNRLVEIEAEAERIYKKHNNILEYAFPALEPEMQKEYKKLYKEIYGVNYSI